MIHNNRRNIIEICFMQYLKLFRGVSNSALFTKVMQKKFPNIIEFMSIISVEQRLKKYFIKNLFFARTISKLVEFTPLSSTNIPTQIQLLITSVKFLASYT